MKRVLILVLALSVLPLSNLYAQSAAADTTDAAADTTEAAVEATPAPAPVMPAETMATDDMAADDANAIRYNLSVALGSTLPFNPDEFSDNWDPSIGFMIDVGAARNYLELSLNLDYSFFLSNTIDPHDINILTTFVHLKIKPLDTTARPYVFVGGGFYRFWIVDLDVYENVLGFGGGAGVEIEVDEGRYVFIEGKSVQGQTRVGETAGIPNLRKANVETIPIRFGITFAF